jgi:outer membrane protein assembly factor BamB
MKKPFTPAHDRAPMRHALLNIPPAFLSRTTLIVGAILLAAAVPFATANDWSQWRGPMNTGVTPEANPPLRWSETENVKWKVAIPGFGTSTPIIRDNQVFILTAIPTGKKPEPQAAAAATTDDAAGQEGQGGRRGRGGFGGEPAPDEIYQFVVLSLDRQTGQTLWQKVAREQVPHEGHHQDHGFASASPITDGDVLIVPFGSRGIYGYDLQGNLKWEKDLGDMQTRLGFGEGSSPALHGDTVVVLWDHEGDDDFLVALDKNTGEELWRTPRDERTTWSTPLIVEHNGTTQVIVNAANAVRGYDLATGQQIWQGPALTDNPIPSPVVGDGIVYATSGFRGSALYAIQLGQTGNLEGSDAIVWSHDRSTPYVPTPLLYDGLLYFVASNNGILSCLDAKTGEPHFDAERLEGIRGIYASPVGAADRVYVLGRDGTCLVLKKGPTLEVLATNKLDDNTDASIALVGRDLFIRGHKTLYCLTGE